MYMDAAKGYFFGKCFNPQKPFLHYFLFRKLKACSGRLFFLNTAIWPQGIVAQIRYNSVQADVVKI
jgi:hypothetical protein